MLFSEFESFIYLNLSKVLNFAKLSSLSYIKQLFCFIGLKSVPSKTGSWSNLTWKLYHELTIRMLLDAEG